MKEKLEPDVISALLGLFAHDMRNPLSALQSNVGFVKSVLDDTDPDVNDALADGLASCQGLGDIIDNLEILAYELRDAPPSALGPVSIVLLLEEVAKRVACAAASHETRVELDLGGHDRSLMVHAQRDMLQRALSNLVRNSIQHGGKTPVVVSLSVGEGVCRVRVEDRGTPLGADMTAHAFSAAGQLVAKSARGGRYGRGLALYCARAAAEVSGASVRAIDVAGGCAFELTVPVATEKI